jgi:hypothetical protein
LLEACELVFVDWEARVRAIGEFVPAVTGLRLKREGCRVDGKISITVRSVAVQIHVSLNEESFAAGIGMLQLKDRFAVVKVMSREKEVETVEPFAQKLNLVLVERFKMGRDARGVEEPPQLTQDFRELRIIPGQVFDGKAGMG